MAKVRPFRASYYDPGQASFAQVLSPPYDVISPALQAELYARDPHNFVRIDYGQTQAEDAPGQNVYTRSAGTLEAWLAEGVFATADRPGYYLHTQKFQHQGQSHTRRDLFVLCEASPFAEKQVLPHERTLDGPKADRYALMEAVQSHLSPVFALYEDPEKQLTELLAGQTRQQALFTFVDHEGIEHTVHACQDEQILAEITAFLAERPLYIADGHHRYETALAFRKAHYPANEAAGYVCMYLSALQDEGLLVLPYHRLIRSRFVWPDSEILFRQLAQYFHVQKIAACEIETALKPSQPLEMRLVMETREGVWVLHRNQGLPEGFAGGRASSYRSLDVSVLHELLLYKLAGFPVDKAKDPNYIQFSPDISVLQETLRTEGGVAFYLNPTPVSALCEIAVQGETMPPKSTYFYPKVPSGLLFTRFNTAF